MVPPLAKVRLVLIEIVIGDHTTLVMVNGNIYDIHCEKKVTFC